MAITFPTVNESGYYEIRLESIGGLGANLCGKMLGEIGVKYLGINSSGFSSYGSEKTGTPVRAFIRYCSAGQEIRVHAPVLQPHLLVIFHEALLSQPQVLEGCSAETTILIHSARSPEEIQRQCIRQTCGEVYCVPAQEIAIATKSRINVVMLGAMARVMGFIPLETVDEVCRQTLGKKYPDALAGNLEGIHRGYEAVQGRCQSGETEQEKTAAERVAEKTSEKEIKETASGKTAGQDGQPLGGINPWYGSSVTADVSPSRQGYIPIFRQERCINCGLCDSTCPDMVFQFQKGSYKGNEMMVNKGLDYYHCKGCLRCVEVCPTQALIKGKEADYPDKPWFLPNQELVRMPEYYEPTGADGYITSEAYLTEKRMEGGEV